MDAHDATDDLIERVTRAHAARTPLRIVGGGTKDFYGRATAGEPLSLERHRGIVNYDPAELVLTARAGTPLSEIEHALELSGQRLAFEPPHFGPTATFGGMVAAGLAGPARASSGPLRDYVLGCRLLTGDGRVLRFGGEVMKNVAGYDVSRLMTGSLGILGVLLDISIKVLPRPAAERTLTIDCDLDEALERLQEACGTPRAPAASCWTAGRLSLRYEGSPRTVEEQARRHGGEVMYESTAFWRSLREQSHAFFRGSSRWWRLHVSSVTRAHIHHPVLVEWHGAQRWYADDPDVAWHAIASDGGGHATLFRGARDDEEVFTTLPPALLRVHRSLKQTFDPDGILNAGRLYREL